MLEPMEGAGWEGDPQESRSWEELAQDQLQFENDWRENLESGYVLALHDRNCFVEEWSRRVLVLVDDECVYVFDESGQPIDEPSNFVPLGRQELYGDKGFLAELASGEYYRLPPASSLVNVEPSASSSGFLAVSALASRAIASVLSSAAAAHGTWTDIVVRELRAQKRMALPAPSSDGSLQRCTIAVVTDSAVAVLFDSCRVRKVDKAQFLKLLLSELNP